MSPAEELERLREGGSGPPPADADVLEQPASSPVAALAKVRSVLEVVLDQSGGGEWPGLDQWKRLLPPWFVAACIDDAHVRDCVLDEWSIRAWTYWFKPDLRKWRWWGAEAADGSLRITVLVESRPYRRGALEWLLQVSSRA